MSGAAVVVTGPPGAGKSTVAALLVERFSPSALVPGDAFFGFVRGGYVDPWRPESHDQNEVVVDAAATATGRFVAGGYTVVYDGVIGPWFVDTFLRAAHLEALHYALLLPSLDGCLERVRTRQGHGFTDLDAARHMYAQFADGRVASRHVVAADDPPAAVADRIAAAIATGRLLVRAAGAAE